jgi:hypothetical protein
MRSTALRAPPGAFDGRPAGVLDTGPGLVNQASNTLSSSASWEYRQRSGEGRRKEPAPTVTGAALQEQVLGRALERENVLLGFSSAERMALVGFLHRLPRNFGSNGT